MLGAGYLATSAAEADEDDEGDETEDDAADEGQHDPQHDADDGTGAEPAVGADVLLAVLARTVGLAGAHARRAVALIGADVPVLDAAAQRVDIDAVGLDAHQRGQDPAPGLLARQHHYSVRPRGWSRS